MVRIDGKISIAILIVTYQRKKKLLNCLKSIVNQTRHPDHIIIVERESVESDGGRKIIEDFVPNDIKVSYQIINSGNVSVSRNIAMSMVKEDFGLFVDDDVILSFDYVEKLLNIYKNYPEKNFVVGSIYPVRDNYWQNFSLKLLTSCLNDQKKIQMVKHWPALNFSFRLNAIKKFKLAFDESYSGLEDIFFCLKIEELGEFIYYYPNILVWHSFRNTRRKFVKSFEEYFLNIKKLNLDFPGNNIFQVDFYTRNYFYTFFDYLRLLRDVYLESLEMKRNLKLSVVYLYGCMVYFFVLIKALKKQDYNL